MAGPRLVYTVKHDAEPIILQESGLVNRISMAEPQDGGNHRAAPLTTYRKQKERGSDHAGAADVAASPAAHPSRLFLSCDAAVRCAQTRFPVSETLPSLG